MGDKSLFEQSFTNFGRIPREAWFVALFACVLSAAGDVAYWASGSELSWTWSGPILVRAVAWLAAVYVAALGILGCQTSFRGYLAFAATSLATIAPIALTLAFGIFAKPYFPEGTRISIILVGMVITFVLASLLAGWPVAQSVKESFVSPIRLLRATRGHRGSLVFVGFTASALGRSDMIPDISTANNIGEAALIALGDGLIGLFVLGLTAAIGATAWQFALRQDEQLES